MPLIVAELSANHAKSLEIALQSIQKAKEIGADCIKIQTYTPDCLTLNAPQKHFKIKGGLWDGESLYDLYKRAYTPFEWHQDLFAYAKDIGIPLFSTPFSFKGLELLESLQCPMYKIASFEITDLELIAEVAKTQKPIILSSGIGSDEEICEAIEVCKQANNHDITLLKCTSSYPTPLREAHLRTMQSFGKKWNVKFGLSDHTQGFLAPVIATSLGASMIEKHFILDKSLQSPDCAFSLDSQEFAEMIGFVRQATEALGQPDHQNTQTDSKRVFSRSIFIAKQIPKGAILTRENLTIKRPNTGLPPKELKHALGKRATRDLEFGKPLEFQDFN